MLIFILIVLVLALSVSLGIVSYKLMYKSNSIFSDNEVDYICNKKYNNMNQDDCSNCLSDNLCIRGVINREYTDWYKKNCKDTKINNKNILCKLDNEDIPSLLKKKLNIDDKDSFNCRENCQKFTKGIKQKK